MMYVKSHCEAPDWEWENDYKTREEAIQACMSYGWERDFVEDHLHCEDDTVDTPYGDYKLSDIEPKGKAKVL